MEEGGEHDEELRSVASTPTWCIAIVLAFFVAISLILERSIHKLTHMLRKTYRKPLYAALEKMKEELMLLGFMSLLLTATSRSIASICVSSRFYNGTFTPCSRSETVEDHSSKERNPLKGSDLHSFRRMLRDMNSISCKEDHEPFVSYEVLEQLHRFIFVMAITHITYSCLTMLLAVVKVHRWRAWENEAHRDHEDVLTGEAKQLIIQRQTAFVVNHRSNPLTNRVVIWVICFFRQFGSSVVRADYLTLRKGFVMNHNLMQRYDFHSYMVRSMEEEFQKIVGISVPLWGFVILFMLFNVKGFHLYFWIAIIPITLVLIVGAKLQQVMATLTLESAGITSYFTGTRLKPRDELFWFKKPEWLLSLIHFILFQNAFDLASFFWFWWQFGYKSCFLRYHTLIYIRIALGIAGQFLCSYITLPLYALVTQMGTNFKAALIPQGVRETIHGWGKETRRKRRRKRMHGRFTNDPTQDTDTCTVTSADDNYHQSIDIYHQSVDIYHQSIDIDGPQASTFNEIELQPVAGVKSRRNFSSF